MAAEADRGKADPDEEGQPKRSRQLRGGQKKAPVTGACRGLGLKSKYRAIMDGFRHGERSPSSAGNSKGCPKFHLRLSGLKEKPPDSSDRGFKSRGE